jgi:bifunctional UDP-N-acetylglucosamine pyrophosphorylase / glucosamine-1-phosphate N-acetyltransferase
VVAPTVVIIAAGEGTRMRSSLPKVLHPLCGRPLINWPVAAALEAGAEKVVVVDNPKRRLADHLPEGVEVAIQEQPNGTGDAVAAAGERFKDAEVVLVINGDVPLVTAEALAELARVHEESGAAGTVVTMELDDPSGYGRVVRAADGGVERIVETKVEGDATPEQLAIREVNTGVYAFHGTALMQALERLQPDNAQGELYLPDVLPELKSQGVRAHVVTDSTITLGVNDRVELARVRKLAQQRIHERHMRAGVTIVDPDSTLIDADVTIGRDTTIEPASFIRGNTRIGDDCLVGPCTTLVDTTLGDGVSVPHSYLVQATVEDNGTIGPFAYLRPAAHLHPNAKAGAFVEIKNSTIGRGTKVPHLSYIGDADIGQNTNIGASNITANYDGKTGRKSRTRIGSNVRTSVDTAFVAPVEVGDGAYTGAGSVITEDVPPDALAVARARQKNIADYAKRPPKS